MTEARRYNSVAISLHWLIAFCVFGLLAMGKYMTQLEANDPLRYTLTQLHKSVGITVLLLALLRVLWRITHKPPPLPSSATGFEKFASTVTHLVLYLLMVVIPVSGWVMVSASPLKLETLLFGVIPWPHISYFAVAPERELITERSALIHMWMGNVMLLLVLLHTSAALFHQWIRKDQLISRMVVAGVHKKSGDLNHGLIFGVVMAAAGGLFLVNAGNSQSHLQATGGVTTPVGAPVDSDPNTSVTTVPATAGFTAMQSGDQVVGEFKEVWAVLKLDKQSPAASLLTATVMTASVQSNDAQLDATMVTADWFASDEFPEANFQSTGFVKTSDTTYTVSGELTIRGNTNPVEFELLLEDKVGRGEFVINRSDFGVGDSGQDEFVDPEVVVRFAVPSSG